MAGSPTGAAGKGSGLGGGLALLVLVALALALKAATFGDPNRSADETFYFLVGQRMHEGLLPYVDVWDRKPLGLFLIYYAITGLSASVWGYQIAACLFAAATAFVIARMVSRWTGATAGLFAGIAYVFVIGPLEGSTGQTPDFYNLFVATAAMLAAREADALARGELRWPGWAAMALCGLALTIKQTTVFEGLFLGLWIVARLAGAGVAVPRLARIAGLFAIAGVLPTALCAGYYWHAGHWHEFWHAMVTSNLAKAQSGGHATRIAGIALKSAPIAALAIWGLWPWRGEPWVRRFLIGWIAAALIGFVIVPNLFGHYFLPVLVPLSAAAGLAFGAQPRRVLLLAFVAVYAAIWNPFWERRATRDSIASMEAMAAIVRERDSGGGLLVFDGPHALYSMTGERFLSPLVFSHHLNHQIENNVSHLDTHAELDRILAGRPGVIVMARYPMNRPVNAYNRERVLAYARANCRTATQAIMSDRYFRNPMVIFGDCVGK